MSWLEFGLMFSLGLAGSLHCVQMCGPLVLSFSLATGPAGRLRAGLLHVAYHLGRVATYGLLGAAAGLLGGGVSRVTGYERTAALAAGVIMVITGLAMTGLVPSSGLVRIGVLQPASFLTRRLARLLGSTSYPGKLALGLLMGFLPCGLIYAALLKSLESSSPVSGALTMVTFGVGTAGPLLAVGVFSSVLNRRLGRYSTRIAALAVMAMGAFLVWRGMLPAATGACPQHHH